MAINLIKYRKIWQRLAFCSCKDPRYFDTKLVTTILTWMYDILEPFMNTKPPTWNNRAIWSYRNFCLSRGVVTLLASSVRSFAEFSWSLIVSVVQSNCLTFSPRQRMFIKSDLYPKTYSIHNSMHPGCSSWFPLISIWSVAIKEKQKLQDWEIKLMIRNRLAFFFTNFPLEMTV